MYVLWDLGDLAQESKLPLFPCLQGSQILIYFLFTTQKKHNAPFHRGLLPHNNSTIISVSMKVFRWADLTVR